MKPDYLNGTGYEIIQPQGMYHFNSDTELLGRFMKAHRRDRVLDIGTNTGALLLYAARFSPALLHGVDLFPEVLETAAENMELNHVEAEFFCSRIQDFSGGPYDVIVCNPPYFQTVNEKLVNDNPYLAAARHEQGLTPDELFAAAARLMKSSGRFFLVHRCTRMAEIFQTAYAHGMIPERLHIAYDHQDGRARSFVCSFRCGKKGDMKIGAPVWLDDRSSFAVLEESI